MAKPGSTMRRYAPQGAPLLGGWAVSRFRGRLGSERQICFTNPQSLANFVIPAMVDQPGSNWALGNHCFHGVYEALPLNSEASQRYRWGTVGRLDVIEETEGRW